MKIRLSIICLIFFSSCNQNSTIDTQTAESDDITRKIADQFDELSQLLKDEKGKFWDHQLYGPMMVVDPNTREFWANQNDKSKSLQADGRVFRGKLEPQYTISNTAFDYKQERWTMVIGPLPENSEVRNALAIHECFHRIQPDVGFTDMIDGNNAHLDDKKARIYLKLELEALKKGMLSNDPAGILFYAEHALWFRKLRHEAYENAAAAENKLEINEGLAEYTGLMLGFDHGEKRMLHLQNKIDNAFQQPSFVRSFAYYTVPAYGILLSQIKSQWHLTVDINTNLTNYFIDAFNVEFPEHLSDKILDIQDEYNYTLIESQETAREKSMLAEINKYKQRLLADSFLVIPLIQMNFSFDPSNVLVMGEEGKVYPTTTIVDNWGKLEVSKGALINNDWNKVNISKPLQFTDSLITGDGWSLRLVENWKVEAKNGNYIVETTLR